ncbi:MAG TPA: hypothetical protein VJ508_03795, partial [Saprospiraceae bacterium]|nr:hypothetical protein [Saprospiraceae bacterium]
LDYTYSNRLKSGSLTTNLDQHSLTASLSGNGRYFISYKSYLNVNFNTYYTYSNNDQFFLDTKSTDITNRVQASLSASLVVAIF